MSDTNCSINKDNIEIQLQNESDRLSDIKDKTTTKFIGN